MIKLIVQKIDNYNYELNDNNGNIYNVNIEFYNLDKKIDVNDFIYIDENKLKEIDKQMVNFEVLNKEKVQDEKEIIIIEYQDGTKIYLNQIYG